MKKADETPQMRLVLNAFAVLLRRNLEPMKAVWAMSESPQVNQIFYTVMARDDFARIRTIGDARESKILSQSASALADQITKYAKKFGDTPVLLCGTLVLAVAGTNLRIQVPDGFSIRLWFDETRAHFDMALRGARLS